MKVVSSDNDGGGADGKLGPAFDEPHLPHVPVARCSPRNSRAALAGNFRRTCVKPAGGGGIFSDSMGKLSGSFQRRPRKGFCECVLVSHGERMSSFVVWKEMQLTGFSHRPGTLRKMDNGGPCLFYQSLMMSSCCSLA